MKQRVGKQVMSFYRNKPPFDFDVKLVGWHHHKQEHQHIITIIAPQNLSI
jgi:hypothetical protein